MTIDRLRMLPVGKTCMDCQLEPYCSKYGVDTADRIICSWGVSRFARKGAATAPLPADKPLGLTLVVDERA